MYVYITLCSPLKVQLYSILHYTTDPSNLIYPFYFFLSFLLTTNWSDSLRVYSCFILFIHLLGFFTYHIGAKLHDILSLPDLYFTKPNTHHVHPYCCKYRTPYFLTIQYSICIYTTHLLYHLSESTELVSNSWLL